MSSHPGLEDASEPPDLEGLTPEERVEVMIGWFHENFEDPANETPRDDGEFQFIWGGPFDAEDELISAFPDAEPEEIEEARDELNSNVIDWAPAGHRISNPDDLEDELPLSERLAALESQMVVIAGHLAQLVALQTAANAHAGIGHNNPPDELTIGVEDIDLLGVQQSIGEIRQELARPDRETDADRQVIERAEGRFQAFRRWIAGKMADLAWEGTKGIAKGVGQVSGTAAATVVGIYLSQHGSEILHTVGQIAETLFSWLVALPPPI